MTDLPPKTGDGSVVTDETEVVVVVDTPTAQAAGRVNLTGVEFLSSQPEPLPKN